MTATKSRDHRRGCGNKKVQGKNKKSKEKGRRRNSKKGEQSYKILQLMEEFNRLLKRYRDGLVYIFDDPELTPIIIEERKGRYYKSLKGIRRRMSEILWELEKMGVEYEDLIMEEGF